MRYIKLCFLMLALNACANTIEYKEVYIPVQCDVAEPAFPVQSDSVAVSVTDILEYTKALLVSFRACKGE